MERTIPRKTHQRERVQFATSGDSLTKQSFSRECDINQIMLKWQKTGLVSHTNNFQGNYGDFLGLPSDFQEAQNQVLAAQAMFSSLPSSIRKRFGNDPSAFLDFVQDDENREEMVRLGLASKPDDPDPVIEPEPPVKAGKPAPPPKGGDE